MKKMKRFMSFSVCFVFVLSMLISNHSTVSAKDSVNAGKASVMKSIEWEQFNKGLAKVTLNVDTIGGEYDEVVPTGKNAVVTTKSNDLFVVNSSGDCEDVPFTVLPETITSSEGTATVDSATKEVKWELGDLPHDASHFTLTYQVEFNVAAIKDTNTVYTDVSTLTYDRYDKTEENTVLTSVRSNQDKLEFYRVIFMNADESNTVLKTELIMKNGDATAPKDPTLPETPQYTYTFAGWEGTYTNVTSDQVVVAKYTNKTKTYKVTFVDEDGITVLETDVVKYGEGATYSGKTPTKSAKDMYTYQFIGWDKKYDCIVSDLTVKAVYKTIIDIIEPTPPADNPKPEDDPTKNEPTINEPAIDVDDDDTPAGDSVLPETGTTPADVFYVSGTLLVLTGVSVLVVRKVKRA